MRKYFHIVAQPRTGHHAVMYWLCAQQESIRGKSMYDLPDENIVTATEKRYVTPDVLEIDNRIFERYAS